MAAIYMKSVNGDSVPMYPFEDDVLIPTDVMDDVGKRMGELKQLPYQPGDIMLCSYPKFGTHWVYYLIAKLTHGKHIEEVPPALRGLMELSYESLDSIVSPRILVSHLRPNRLPKAHWDNGKIVLVLRNPKDVAVSLYSHLKKDTQIALLQTWDEFLDSFMNGIVMYKSCFDYILAWDKIINDEGKDNVLVLFYEELKANPIECMKRLQKHLGLDHSEEALEKMVEECSLSKLKESLRTQEAGFPRLDGDTQTYVDQEGNSVLYRKGVVADWKNHFTVAQNEAFDKLIEEKLKDVRFKFNYE